MGGTNAPSACEARRAVFLAVLKPCVANGPCAWEAMGSAFERHSCCRGRQREPCNGHTLCRCGRMRLGEYTEGPPALRSATSMCSRGIGHPPAPVYRAHFTLRCHGWIGPVALPLFTDLNRAHPRHPCHVHVTSGNWLMLVIPIPLAFPSGVGSQPHHPFYRTFLSLSKGNA
eukprot:scaffold587_cov339-Pavlova_lutheri.AAC.47